MTIGEEKTAYAYTVPSVTSVTAVTDYGVNANGEVTLTRGDYDGINYAKDIIINFDLGGADYYRVNVTVDTTEIEGAVTPVTDPELVYPVTANGNVTVKVITYNDGYNKIGEVERSVKSDVTAPTAAGVAMTEWLAVGNPFTARFAFDTFEDNYVTLGEVYYRVNDGEIKQADTSSLDFSVTVENNSSVTVYWFDAAGNSYVDVSELNKFDSALPPAPTITITPNVSPAVSGGFARYYTVSIDYHSDAGSGLKSTQTYRINDVTYDYTGPFDLRTARDYVIKASAEDNVGNLSIVTSRNIFVETYDIAEPAHSGFTLDIDLRRENICISSVTVIDGQSGVKRVQLDEGAVFDNVSGDLYRAYIDIFQNRSSALVMEDNVGNVGRKLILVNFADNRDYYLDKIQIYVDKYKNIHFEEYTDDAKTEIEASYVALNTVVLGLIIGGDFSRTDFDAACVRVDNAVKAENTTYVINGASSYLTGMLTYEINYADFDGYKKGEEIKLVFDKAGVENRYVSMSGFGEGFCDAFTLKIYRNGAEVSGKLSEGIKVALAMPAGYYERNYAVFYNDAKLTSKCVNNKVEFTVYQGGKYNLVISGDETVRENENNTKYISVFGHKLSYAAFFGTVFGVAGVAIIIIIALVIVSVRSRD